uniref:Homoserine kinase n=1 Tax=Lygus hesperus TaxID=30085 RepID=A0A0A9WTJ7_LYGHE
MLSVLIGLLAFGVTIPGFEAYTNWEKTELDSNSTRHQSHAENPERRQARNSFITQPTENSNNLKANVTLFDKMYGPKRNVMSPSSTKIQDNKIPWHGFRASTFFRPRYKSLKTTCDCNVYKVYSNNEKSVMFRNNYELWSNVNYFPESRSVSLKIRRSEPEEELSGDGRFIYDDDYSLINYVDKGKWGNDVTANQRGQTVKRTPKKKNSKREAEDREFSVMFHSRKDNEYRDKFSNNHDFLKNGKKKSMLHFEKKKYKHESGSKPERKMTFLERRNNLRESYNHVARTPLNLKSSKKKYPFWLSKKEKFGTKHETFSAILTSPKASASSLIPPRKVLHWATTRSYVAAISAQNNVTPATLSPNAHLVPPALIPFLNLNLTDSLLTARKSDVASYPSTPATMNRPAILVNQSGSPQYLRVGNNNLDLRSLNLNPNLAFPFGFNMPIAKPMENNAGVYGPPAQVTTPVVFFFNAPTEGINPLSNHLDKFKNTTTWNAKQGPPGNLNAV